MTKRLFSVVAFLTCAAHAADWQPLPPLPEPNGGFMLGVDNKKIVIVGGTNWEGGKKNWLKAVRVFDPSTQKWSSARDLETPLAYAPVFDGGDRFAFLGGFEGGEPSGKFAMGSSSYLIELHWELDLPKSLVLAAGGAVGDVLVVSGGTNDPANLAGLTRATYSFQWGKVNWRAGISAAETGRSSVSLSGGFHVSKLADYPGKPFAVAASAVAGSELFIFGGMNYDSAAKAPSNSVEAYAFSPAKSTWRKLQPLAVPNRGLTAVTLDDQHIYLAGGYTTDFTADAFIYDVKSNTYAKAKSLPYAAMVGLIKLDSFIHCLGGEDKQKSRTDKFFRIPADELLK
ncbi:MAG: kelch repeat-containing protein [Prosthecobacter sp.]